MTFDHAERVNPHTKIFGVGVNKPFRYALILSVIFHAIAAANWPFYGRLFSVKDQFKEIEITYVKVNEPPAAAPKKPEGAVRKSLPQPESAQPAKIVSEELPKAGQPKKPEAAVQKKDIAAEKKDETIIEKKLVPEKRAAVTIKQPVAVKTATTASVGLSGLRLVPPSYAHTVRSRIIENLDSDDPGEEGDVFVKFVITLNGELKDINIEDEKSSKDSALRRMAFDAVRDSSPFPRFPKDVLAPEITFTCQISFLRK